MFLTIHCQRRGSDCQIGVKRRENSKGEKREKRKGFLFTHALPEPRAKARKVIRGASVFRRGSGGLAMPFFAA